MCSPNYNPSSLCPCYHCGPSQCKTECQFKFKFAHVQDLNSLVSITEEATTR
ncbi:hypothetical protein Syun_003384 [Stephania yunnanensis]|uniref:Uncharacterized protein n=1 Tax=Stephania yunnanensis TaxID=152371 RepID=A0AAP0L2Q6_9MAGN